MITDIVRQKGFLALGSRLKRIGEHLQGDVQQLLKDHGIPIQSGHYPLLVALDEIGPMPVGDLAQALGLSQPGITRSVGQLAQQSLVTIRRGTKDQRTKMVTLTNAGHEIVRDGRENVWPQIEAALLEILGDQSRPLLDHLNILEDALNKSSLANRKLNQKTSDTHE